MIRKNSRCTFYIEIGLISKYSVVTLRAIGRNKWWPFHIVPTSLESVLDILELNMGSNLRNHLPNRDEVWVYSLWNEYWIFQFVCDRDLPGCKEQVAVTIHHHITVWYNDIIDFAVEQIFKVSIGRPQVVTPFAVEDETTGIVRGGNFQSGIIPHLMEEDIHSKRLKCKNIIHTFRKLFN